METNWHLYAIIKATTLRITTLENKTNLLITKTNLKLLTDIYSLLYYNLSLLQTRYKTKVVLVVSHNFSYAPFYETKSEIEQFSFKFNLMGVFCKFSSALVSFQTLRHMEKIMWHPFCDNFVKSIFVGHIKRGSICKCYVYAYHEWR